MTTLRVIVDQMTSPVPGGIGRYTEELTRGLIAVAPAGCSVVGIVSASSEAERAGLLDRLPGLAGIETTALPRRALQLAWQFGLAPLRSRGPVHATSLLAPLSRHGGSSQGRRVAVTIHDTVPWTNPETLSARGVSWHRAMARRAERFADAIVVPTQAVANELSDILRIDGRVSVISGAVSANLSIPSDAQARAERLGLPPRYVLAVGTLEPRKGLARLITSMASPSAPDIPLVIAGPSGWGGVDIQKLAGASGLPNDRIRTLGYLSNPDLAVAMSRATVFAFPSLAEGFGLPVLEAMSLGVPVVHTDAPALLEVGGGAGLVVSLQDSTSFADRLGAALRRVVDEPSLAGAMRATGLVRSQDFSWEASATRAWDLHLGA